MIELSGPDGSVFALADRGPLGYAASLAALPGLMGGLSRAYPWLQPTLEEVLPRYDDRSDASHDSNHLLDTVAWTGLLWIGEASRKRRADLEIALAGIVYHDRIVRRKDDPESANDNEESAQLAEAFLPTVGFPLPKLPEVGHIVRRCSYTRGGTEVRSPEEAIVRDADMVQCLGVTGFSRFLQGGGRIGRPFRRPDADFFDQARPPDRWSSSYDAIRARGLGVISRLFTESARAFVDEARLAEEMRAYLEQAAKEAQPAIIAYEALFRAR